MWPVRRSGAYDEKDSRDPAVVGSQDSDPDANVDNWAIAPALINVEVTSVVEVACVGQLQKMAQPEGVLRVEGSEKWICGPHPYLYS